ncbi:DNA repair protein RecO [Alphaproteobacteria bacterium]|nr:DNA repair protein RecO [Alphaproteobacteria bacterium]MDA8544613.1 DNA repair protein RecO [Alphaproteobacteria bacterium]MDB2393329.1 DNA repair protein RecO [Alphaproteobacteria bacterium]MDB2431614.1 DNA repair protein RecO [Alphaproteobacteria bacterium]MDB2487917.1 DNA repair protein RecO [Alphaproteobacteria bacterium]
MQWEAEGLVLAARAHGESSAIIDVFSRAHGRFGGLVRGGNSRRLRPVLQPGNMVVATWRARLSEHLGTITVDAGRAHAAEAMSDAKTLAGLTSLCALMQITPERQAYPRLYDTLMLVIAAMDDADTWPALSARFEMALLEEIGFGLDLSCCAATGVIEQLEYVSPRSGRAVSRDAARPYLDKMFVLPQFLLDPSANASDEDVQKAMELTGHFLERRVYLPNGLKMPPARQRLMDMLAR